MKKIVLTVFSLVMLFTTGHAQQQMPTIPLDPAVKTGVLPNGLTYFIRHNEWPEKRVDFYIAQKVGSMQEEENQRGLAHFLEHMCFNGTTHFPGDALKQYLERIGVKFGENLNAYTSFDETVYNINNVNVETSGAIDSCLLILHDWSHDLLLEDKEIDKERGVINEEWRMRRSAMQRMQEEAFKTLFKDSKYANRMPIGTMEIVMNFPYEDLRSYYRRWYRPDLQALVVVGDVDVDEIEKKIQAVYADIDPAPADAAVREYYPVPDNDTPLVTIQKDKEQPGSYALLLFKTDPAPREMKNTMAYLMAKYVEGAISGMFSERIADLTRKADCPFIGSQISFDEYMVAKTKDAIDVTIMMKDGQYLPGIATMYRELLRAKRGGFTQGEYDRYQQEFLSRVDAMYEARDKVENTSYVNEYVRYFLDNEPTPGIEWEHKTYKQLVPMIPLEVINQSIAQIPENNRAIALFLPDKEGVEYPTEEQILNTLKAVDAEEIEVFAEEVNTDPLVPELTSDVTVKKIKDDVYGAKLLTLSNGLKVHVLQTDYSPNQISMQATSWGGTSLYPNNDYLITSNADMIGLGGWGEFTAIQLQKKLAGIQASCSPSIGNRTENLEGSCVKKDFETMLQLLYLCFTAPHRDDETFQSTLDRYRNALKNQDLNPQVALQDSIASILYNNNVRAVRFRSSDVDKINDYDRLLEVYKERYANAGDFEFYFVGDLNVDSVAPLITKYLGALPVSKGHEKYKKIDNVLQVGQKTCIFDKEQDTPNSVTVFTYHCPMKYNLRNSIMVSMLQQAMSMLYTETVREDEGGAYGVPTRGRLTDYPQSIAVMTIQLPTAPEKLDRMMQVVYDGVDKVCDEGPSADYLQKIKEYMIRSHAEDLKSNSYWMNSLYNKTRSGYEMVKDYDKVVESITTEDLRKLAQKIFRSGNCLVVGMKSPTE